MSNNEDIVLEIQQGINKRDNLKKLYLQNKPLIIALCNRYKGLLEFDDAIQEAYLGLHEAAEHFDHSKGVFFIIYAKYWINEKLQHSFENSAAVKMPSRTTQNILKYNRLVYAYFAEFGKEPTNTYISKALGIEVSKIEKLKASAYKFNLISLDAPLPELDEASMFEIVEGSKAAGEIVQDKEEQKQINEDIRKALEELPENSRDVLHVRYWQDKSLRNASKVLGTTPTKVRTIEYNALRQLRKNRTIKRIGEEYGYIRSMGMKGTGLGAFNHSFTSATEYTTMKLLER